MFETISVEESMQRGCQFCSLACSKDGTPYADKESIGRMVPYCNEEVCPFHELDNIDLICEYDEIYEEWIENRIRDQRRLCKGKDVRSRQLAAKFETYKRNKPKPNMTFIVNAMKGRTT